MVNELEAKQAQETFKTFLKVSSVRRASVELSKRGIRSKKFTNKRGLQKGDGHFTVMGLQRLLTNRVYIGLRDSGSKSTKVEMVKANWLGIIAEDGKHLGGKSGHSHNGNKHFYYGHPRQLMTDGVNHLRRCSLENVRAIRIEDIILNSLKGLAADPKLIERWLKIYASNTMSEIPALEGKLKTVTTDIQTHSKRLENLVTRLSGLPQEISADPIHKQIQIITGNIKELERTRLNLEDQSRQLTSQMVNSEELILKIKRTIANLEKAPVELRRPVYSNLIKFAELHPTKIRLGLFAPTAPVRREAPTDSDFKATGTDGPRRGGVGSCTVTNGAPRETRTLMT